MEPVKLESGNITLNIEPETTNTPDKLDYVELLKSLNMKSERQSGEQQDDYRKRRHLISMVNKFKMKPTIFWDSKENGTRFKKPKTNSV